MDITFTGAAEQAVPGIRPSFQPGETRSVDDATGARLLRNRAFIQAVPAPAAAPPPAPPDPPAAPLADT